MKKFIAAFIVCVLMSSVSFAQEMEPKFEKQDDLVKATYYHDNGMVKEVGFFKNDKLHDKWISYNKEGQIKVVAVYNNGQKEENVIIVLKLFFAIIHSYKPDNILIV